MKELSVKRILNYITQNTRGNILINEIPDETGDYLMDQGQEYLQPRKLFLFCDEFSKQQLKAINGGMPFPKFNDLMVTSMGFRNNTCWKGTASSPS